MAGNDTSPQITSHPPLRGSSPGRDGSREVKQASRQARHPPGTLENGPETSWRLPGVDTGYPQGDQMTAAGRDAP